LRKSVLLFISIIYGQSFDVTFRYVASINDDFIRVFIPGTMPSGTSNDWGPNSNGMIDPNAPSRMDYNQTTDSYEKTYSLNVGEEYQYKIHFHHNSSGSDYSWIPDPLNPLTTDDNWTNSILNVSDPLFFQAARHINNAGEVAGFSIGIFASENIDSIRYSIGGDTLPGTQYYQGNGVLYIPFDSPLSVYDPIWVQASISGSWDTVYDFGAIEIIEEPMPAGIELGPTWIDNSMFLAVYAPSQPVMRVIIDTPGNSTETSEAMTMYKDPNIQDTWWIELDLPNGEYEYEYLLINGNRIADPLSRRLTNGKTRIEIGSGGISTADDFVWGSIDYIRPSLDTLIIYELHVDDFSSQGNGQGTFSDVIERLDHLKMSGINAIELLPITEFPGTHSWGYDPQLMSAVEENYGTPEEFKRLVDEAHSRGIAVIMDLVWNHIKSTSPIWEIQPDYDLNPYIKLHTDLNPNEAEGSWGMLDWDHFNPSTIDYINRVNKIWVDEYKVDGFRFDAMYMIGWDMQQQEYGIPAWSTALKDYDSTVYQIAEHLPSNPWLIENTDLSSGWHDSFHDRLLNDVHGQSLSTMSIMRQIVGLHEYSDWGDPYNSRTQAVKYMVSHDEQSILQEMVTFNSYSIEEARNRDKFYATMLFTSLGIPMLFQGQEFGLQTGWNDDNNNGNYDDEKLQYRPVDWSLLDTDIGQSHLEHYSKLARLRKSNPAFYKGTFYDLYRYTSQKVIVYGYKDESPNNNDDQVVVIANFSSLERTIENVPFLSSGTWYDVLSPINAITIGEDNYYDEYSIPAKSAIVFTNRDYQLQIPSSNEPVPDQFEIIKCYPNPFNGKLNIRYHINEVSNIHATIYDLSGKVIKSFEYEQKNPGQHQLIWDTKNNNGDAVATGLYFVSLSSENRTTNKKVLYLK